MKTTVLNIHQKINIRSKFIDTTGNVTIPYNYSGDKDDSYVATPFNYNQHKDRTNKRYSPK